MRSSEFISPHVDAHVGDAGMDADARLDLALDVGAERAAADRQLDADRDDTVGIDVDRWHHAERHDVGAELGIDDRAEHGEHVVTTRRCDATSRRRARAVDVGSVLIGRILPAPAV